MPHEISEQSSPPEILLFPKSFPFGAAVSSFQVERPDSSRQTDWDEFIRNNPDKEIIKEGEIGPDWWNEEKARADLQKVAALGLDTFRFSIEWARIYPEEHTINYAALTQYRRLVDFMQDLGLKPILTMHHFTLPLWLAKQGGWSSRNTIRHFIEYTSTLIQTFPDVKTWITINEPNVLVQTGYLIGIFPPNRKNIFAALTARGNLLEAHRQSFHLIKDKIHDARVGLAHGFRWYRPERADIIGERYYARLIDYLDSKNYTTATNNTVDFIGCNFYSGYYLDLNPRTFSFTMRKDAANIPETFLFGQTKKPGAYVSDMGWPVVPDFLLALLRNLHRTYNRPILITENGIADSTDQYRNFYILTHLVAVWKALQEGITVEGYNYWSAVDNLEWIYGFEKRFGLIEVDHRTGERRLRESARLYEEIVTTHKIHYEELLQKYLPEDQQDHAKKIIFELLTAGVHSPRLRYSTITE